MCALFASTNVELFVWTTSKSQLNFHLFHLKGEIEVDHLITEDVQNDITAKYMGHRWLARYNQPNAKVLSTTEPNFINVKSNILCLRSMEHGDCNLDANDRFGVSFWMRYKGDTCISLPDFIPGVIGTSFPYIVSITKRSQYFVCFGVD